MGYCGCCGWELAQKSRAELWPQHGGLQPEPDECEKRLPASFTSPPPPPRPVPPTNHHSPPQSLAPLQQDRKLRQLPHQVRGMQGLVSLAFRWPRRHLGNSGPLPVHKRACARSHD